MYRSLLLLSMLGLCGASSAQIPNGDFEVWNTSNGYDQADAWNSWNGFTEPYGVFTCTEGNPGHTGASYMQLTTLIVPGLTILPGIAVSGNVQAVLDGFPYSQQPTELIGWWQYSSIPPGADNALITVELTKWNPVTGLREQIAQGQAETTGNVSPWQMFSAPIGYSSSDLPDTAIISLTSSGSGVPQVGSVLRVDDLSFGTSTGVADPSAADRNSAGPLIIDGALVRATRAVAELAVLGMDGRTVIGAMPLASGALLDLSGVAPGAYILRTRTVDGGWHCQRSVVR
jgi:hypothetical protein